jgi:hypothetical protein
LHNFGAELGVFLVLQLCAIECRRSNPGATRG